MSVTTMMWMYTSEILMSINCHNEIIGMSDKLFMCVGWKPSVPFSFIEKTQKKNGRKTISEKNDEKCYSSVGGVNTNTTRPYGEVKILLKFYYFSVNGNTQLQVPCCMFLLLVLLISCFLEFPFVDFSKKDDADDD